jgi:hypothetical protein
MITHFIQQFCGIQTQSFNVLFFVIGNNLAMNFEILATRIKNINYDRKQIQKLQEDFTKLNDLTKEFNGFFYFLMDINFGLYVIMTGAYSIQLVKSDEISKKVAAVVYLVPILILAFLVYKFGEKISREVRLKLLEFAL